jgi:hypothetical protein
MSAMSQSTRAANPVQVPNSPTPAVGYYRRLPEAALTDPRLPRSALAVLGALDGYARDKTECWPAVATLAEGLNLCRRTVQLALARLKSLGYVAEKPSENPTGRVLVLLWRTGGAKPVAPGAQPYSQGLPREGRKPVRPTQSQVLEGRKGVRSALTQTPEATLPASPRAMDPRPTPAERARTLGEWLDAVPKGSPLARMLAARRAEQEQA